MSANLDLVRSIYAEWGRVEADEYRARDDERVRVLVRGSGRGKTSGLELGRIQTRGAGQFHFRDGRVIRYVTNFDRERALADLVREE
jgi:hypothetical protein